MAEAKQNQPSVEKRRALILQGSASEQFSRSARLRDFLHCVDKQSFLNGCAEIHEREIGAKVFGRSLSYDRSQDNIVRVNATESRKPLHTQSFSSPRSASEHLAVERNLLSCRGWRLLIRPEITGAPCPTLSAFSAERVGSPSHYLRAGTMEDVSKPSLKLPSFRGGEDPSVFCACTPPAATAA